MGKIYEDEDIAQKVAHINNTIIKKPIARIFEILKKAENGDFIDLSTNKPIEDPLPSVEYLAAHYEKDFSLCFYSRSLT